MSTRHFSQSLPNHSRLALMMKLRVQPPSIAGRTMSPKIYTTASRGLCSSTRVLGTSTSISTSGGKICPQQRTNSGVPPPSILGPRAASTSTTRKSLVSSTSLHHPLQSSVSRRCFSTTPVAAMVATKLDGTAIAKSIRERLGVEIAERQKLNPRFKPCLKILQGWFTID